MDREEARQWVLPENTDSHDETAHLIDGTDENADGFLSVDEILLHWNLFVGSQATDHGRTLRKVRHSELQVIICNRTCWKNKIDAQVRFTLLQLLISNTVTAIKMYIGFRSKYCRFFFPYDLK